MGALSSLLVASPSVSTKAFLEHNHLYSSNYLQTLSRVRRRCSKDVPSLLSPTHQRQ